jgi:hypothetical protein
MWALHVRTYELDEDGQWVPTLEHVFFGVTKEEALRVSGVHSTTDRFYRGCGFSRSSKPAHWRGITCYSEEWWTRE